MVMSAGPNNGGATLHELQTVYGTRSLYDMLEVITVDAHNRAVINKQD